MSGSKSSAPTATKEELASMVMRLKRELDETREQFQAQLEARPAGEAKDTGYATKIKAPRPESYDGNKETLQAFITQTEAYLMINSKIFALEYERVLCVAGMLKGRAAEWFEPTLRDFMETRGSTANRKKETTAIFSSLTQFWKKLKETFGNPDETRAAERQLRNLKQKGSAGTYAAEFKRLMAKLDLGENDLMIRFYDGLRDNVKDELSKKDRPKTLHEYVTEAIRIDNRLYERQLEKKGQGTPWVRTKPVANTSQRRSTASGHHSGPMDLDATQRTAPKKKGNCYNCGKPGHYSNKCRQPRKHQPLPEGRQANAMGRSGYNKVKPDKETWKPVPENSAQAPIENNGSRTVAMMRREIPLEDWGQEEDLVLVPGYDITEASVLLNLLGDQWERDEVQLPPFGEHEAMSTTSANHHQLAWSSCVYHHCDRHFWQKVEYKWMPSRIPADRPVPHPLQGPDVLGYEECYRLGDYLYLAPQGYSHSQLPRPLDGGRPPLRQRMITFANEIIPVRTREARASTPYPRTRQEADQEDQEGRGSSLARVTTSETSGGSLGKPNNPETTAPYVSEHFGVTGRRGVTSAGSYADYGPHLHASRQQSKNDRRRL
jgi:hypothetical protein